MAARPSKLASQVYEHLLGRILTLDLKPRQTLSEVQIAEETGVSRSPVREAFLRLSSEGFLDIVPQRGTMVAPLRATDLERSQFMREALEVALVRRAMALAVPADLDQALTKAMAVQQVYTDLGDDAAFYDADGEFHRQIAVHAGLPDVFDEVMRLRRPGDRFRHLLIRQKHEPALALQQHRRIAAAMVAGDQDAAVGAMSMHLRHVRDRLRSVEEKYPQYFDTAQDARIAVPIS